MTQDTIAQEQIVGPPTAIKAVVPASDSDADVEKTRPEYLDEAILNVNACCPAFMFKYCPCLVCSFFSVIINQIINCIKMICKCFMNCFLELRKCLKNCFLTLWKCIKCPFIFVFQLVVRCLTCPLFYCKKCSLALWKCLKDCLPKLCCPCMRLFQCGLQCARAVFQCVLKCLACPLRLCNAECGLPCRDAPGCVCILPGKLCGLGFTCPYFCFSCGFKHCIKMPKSERAYWRSLRQTPPSKEELKKMAEERKQKAMAPQQTEMSCDLEKGLRQEIATLKLQLEAKPLQAGGGQQQAGGGQQQAGGGEQQAAGGEQPEAGAGGQKTDSI